MPIKPENRARYPKDWPAIRADILERAEHCCEWPGCGIRNYSVGYWKRPLWGKPNWQPLAGNGPCDCAGQGLDWPSLQPLTYSEARAIAAELDDGEGLKATVIVLTIGHLNHVPEDCDPANLRAWCQQHHLAYDLAHHKANAYMTRRARMNNMELPL